MEFNEISEMSRTHWLGTDRSYVSYLSLKLQLMSEISDNRLSCVGDQIGIETGIDNTFLLALYCEHYIYISFIYLICAYIMRDVRKTD